MVRSAFAIVTQEKQKTYRTILTWSRTVHFTDHYVYLIIRQAARGQIVAMVACMGSGRDVIRQAAQGQIVAMVAWDPGGRSFVKQHGVR